MTQAGGQKSGGIPTATHIDHVGVTVPDLDEAISFFTDVLGCELAWRINRVKDDEGGWMADQLNVHPRALMHVAMVRVGPTANVELFQYEAPDQRQEIPKNSDPGASHLAFYVTDIRAATDYLRGQPGVEVLGEPQKGREGPTQGHEFVYFLTPWGMQMEVISWPEGMPYEQETKTRMYGPEPAWTS